MLRLYSFIYTDINNDYNNSLIIDIIFDLNNIAIDKLNIIIIDFFNKLKLNRFVNNENRTIREIITKITRIYNYLKEKI